MSVPLTNAWSPAPRSTVTPDVRIAVEPLQVIVERLVHFERHRVPRLGSVELRTATRPSRSQRSSLATFVVTVGPPRSTRHAPRITPVVRSYSRWHRVHEASR